MRSVDVGGLDIDSHDLFFGSLIVNGVDVVPLVDAELNRQFPGRELQKAQTPNGLRDGWVAVQAAWETTVRNTPPELLAEERDNPWGDGDWHPTVGDCVRVILEEEWAHLRYLRQDLALLG